MTNLEKNTETTEYKNILNYLEDKLQTWAGDLADVQIQNRYVAMLRNNDTHSVTLMVYPLTTGLYDVEATLSFPSGNSENFQQSDVGDEALKLMVEKLIGKLVPDEYTTDRVDAVLEQLRLDILPENESLIGHSLPYLYEYLQELIDCVDSNLTKKDMTFTLDSTTEVKIIPTDVPSVFTIEEFKNGAIAEITSGNSADVVRFLFQKLKPTKIKESDHDHIDIEATEPTRGSNGYPERRPFQSSHGIVSEIFRGHPVRSNLLKNAKMILREGRVEFVDELPAKPRLTWSPEIGCHMTTGEVRRPSWRYSRFGRNF